MTHEELLAVIEKSRVGGETSLYLNDNQIGDAGAVALAGATHLKWLYLDNNQITDAGAIALAGATHFEALYLRGNQIGDAGAIALKRALPGCCVYI